MKKTIIAMILAAVLVLTSVCFAEAAVDTSSWNRYSFEGSGVTMLIPSDFGTNGVEDDEDSFYYEGNNDVLLQVTQYDGTATTIDGIKEELDKVEYIGSTEIANVGGVDMVKIDDCDDDVCGFVTVSAEGTIYQFMFYPINEEDITVGYDVAQAMIASVEA